GLGTAATKNIGNSSGQVPDMSFFSSNTSGSGLWFKFPNGMILQVLECSCPGTNPAGYTFPLPTSFPTNFSGAMLTPKDSIGDINISPTYVTDSLSAIRVYNFSGGGNSVTALCIGF
ncbi:hypothetical protein IHV39_26345, partial [Escherichia coli]|uniref:gp53-like domain-containing protein n=1 Tax=Escherichia coli TaxID=562 RepID=UPI003C6CE1BD|nr:hypothetical protein [Escherichia coli]